MPACRHCFGVQASAEVRRTKLGHVCKDKVACELRRLRRLGNTPFQRVTRYQGITPKGKAA